MEYHFKTSSDLIGKLESLNVKKNITKKHIESFRTFLAEERLTSLNHLLIYHLLYERYQNEETNDKSALLHADYRQSLVQNIYRKENGLDFDEMPDHIANSAFLKLLFIYLKENSSVKLYNVLFAVFVFNSKKNFQTAEKTDNSKDGGFEGHTRWLLTKHVESYQNSKNTEGYSSFKDYIEKTAPNFSDAYTLYVQTKLAPQLDYLYSYLKISSSITHMLDWIMKLFGKDILTKERSQFLNLKSTIISKYDDRNALRKYFQKEGRRNLYESKFFSYGKYCFDKELLEFDIDDDCHIKLFLVLYFSSNINAKSITGNFETKQ